MFYSDLVAKTSFNDNVKGTMSLRIKLQNLILNEI